ncbi:putative cyclase-domain-containing protein [Macrophomina phaseolina]|uniref:Cyclase-domain-containing protein n=1 Tax=Macrophomina phaseolina TaxID=35725 RepID=A0ABQ8FS36_9PEZI|nr:putative cyclase-domain-containing protein [Macrophomina phaseolina]
MNVPDFDDLPKVGGMPQGCAWGIFDIDGKKDIFGTLNHLTPEVVAAAAKEAKDSISISLNWPLNSMKTYPGSNRALAMHRVHALRDAGMDAHGWDDELSFNTQGSSQWDSLCHYQHQPSGLAYNGFLPRREHFTHSASTAAFAADGVSVAPTLDHWHARGCLVARGVLLDYASYHFSMHKAAFDPFAGAAITVADLEACAAHQDVAFRPGDVLVVRTGWTDALTGKSVAEQEALLGTFLASGIEGSEEAARWIWDRRFAAVAGDAIAWEKIPGAKEDGSAWGPADLVLHQYLLSMFGMPIGELWDLKALAEHCAKTGRYSFLLVSVPLNHPGLIGSPPNAVAIF